MSKKTAKKAEPKKVEKADPIGKVTGEVETPEVTEEHDNRAPEKPESVDETPRDLVTGESLKFHKFAEEPELTGIYREEIRARKDNPGMNQKEGDVIGYKIEVDDDEFVAVPNNYSIREAIGMVKPGAKLHFEYLGKATSQGKPFSKFKIKLLGYVK